MTFDALVLLSDAAEARRNSDLISLLAVIHGDPNKLRKELQRAESLTTRRTGRGRQQGNGEGGGVRLGDLKRMFGIPKVVKQIPPGAK